MIFEMIGIAPVLCPKYWVTAEKIIHVKGIVKDMLHV